MRNIGNAIQPEDALDSSSSLQLKLPPLELTSETQASSELGFKEAAFNFFSSLVMADNTLIADEYIAYCDAVEDFTGESDLSTTEVRVKALDVLFKSHETVESSAKNVVNAAVRDRVCRTTLESFLLHVIKILNVGSYEDKEKFLPHIIKMTGDLGVPKQEIFQHIGELYDKSSEVSVGSPFFNGWTSGLKDITSSLVDLVGLNSNSKLNDSKQQLILGCCDSDLRHQAMELVATVKNVALDISDSALDAAACSFKDEIKAGEKPFRFVLVGEIKHGKSSVFNMLAQEAISPEGEATATTASIIELKYSEVSEYEGRWLSTDSLTTISEYIQEQKNSKRVREYGLAFGRVINAPEFEAGGIISQIDSMTCLHDYLTAKGRWSPGVERISVGLPVQALHEGAVIVDTPGINDPMRVRDSITLNESKEADCVVFVMRGDKFGTESERKFLALLTKESQFISLAVILTHIDHLSSEKEINRVFSEMKEWVLEIFEAEEKRHLISRISFFAFNPHQQNEEANIKGIPGISDFLCTLKNISTDPMNQKAYADNIHEARRKLTSFAVSRLSIYRGNVLAKLPDETKLLEIDKLREKYQFLASEYRTQISTRMQSISERLQYEWKNIDKCIKKLEKSIDVEISEKIKGQIIELGDDYSDEKRWVKFDDDISNRIVREHMLAFMEEHKDKFTMWNREIELFSQEMNALVDSNLESLGSLRGEFVGVCKTNHFLTAVMCRTDKFVSGAESVATISGSMGVTAWALTGNVIFPSFATLASGGAIPLAIGAALAAGWVMHKMFSDPAKRKEEFQSKKIETAKKNLDPFFANVMQCLNSDYNGIYKQFKLIAESKFIPLANEIQLNAREAELRSLIIKRVKRDTLDYLIKMESRFNSNSHVLT